MSGEVAEDPVFEDGVDEYWECGDKQGVEFAVFGDTEMFGGGGEDDFPTVGGVEADEGIGEEDDDKGFGGVAESKDQIVNEGFEYSNL